MKKTLQINIGGLIFNMEETAYNTLSNYLNALKRYFSTYESCEEIVLDIETRIAEKFYKKYPNQGVIELEDVNQIIASMGTVDDFEALKEEEDLQAAPQPVYSTQNGWYKDGKRKLLGGVLAGLAHKYDMDVIWPRVLFLVLTFGLISEGIVGLGFIIAYIVAWIFFPQRMDLEENPQVSKLYRNPNDKVIAGVASGLASYLKIDVKILRILFIVLVGFGWIMYFIFWILIPMATTVTEKLQLEGQPLTIDNIERSVKNSNREPVKSRESVLTKIVLAPFRLIGKLFSFLGRLMKPIGHIVRFIGGVFTFLTGVSLIITSVLGLAAYFGLQTNSEWLTNDNEVLSQIVREFPTLGSIFVFFILFIPGLALVFAGLSLILQKVVGQRSLWLSLLIVWLTALVGTTTIGTKFGLNFAKQQQVIEESLFTLNKNEVLILDNSKAINNYERVPQFNFTYTNGNQLIVSKEQRSQGPSTSEAEKFAKNIIYPIQQKGNTFEFDPEFSLKEGDPFRDQVLTISIKIPKNQPFKLVGNSFRFTHYSRNSLDLNTDETYYFNNEGELVCTTCPAFNPNEKLNIDELMLQFEYNPDEEHHFEKLRNFSSIEVLGSYKVILVQGDSSSIKVYPSRYGKEVKTTIEQNALVLEQQDPFKTFDEQALLVVTTPNIRNVKISNKSLLKMYGFKSSNNLEIVMDKESKAAIHSNSDYLNIDLDHQSKAVITGKVKKVTAKGKNGAYINAESLEYKDASVLSISNSLIIGLDKK